MSFISVEVFGNSIGFVPGSLRVSSKLGQRATLDMQVDDQPVKLVFQLGQIIEMFEDGKRRFTGQLDEYSFKVYPGTGVRRYTLRATDFNIIADRRTTGQPPSSPDPTQWATDPLAWQPRSWQNVPVGQIVKDIAAVSFADPSVGSDMGVDVTNVVVDTALVVTKYDTDLALTSAAFPELAKIATALSYGLYGDNGKVYLCWIDFNPNDNADSRRYLHFQPFDAAPATIALGISADPSNPSLPVVNMRAETIEYKQSREQFANVLHLRMGNAVTDPIAERFDSGGHWINGAHVNNAQQPDGIRSAWALSNSISSEPTIKVDGVVRTVGIDGLDTGKDWYWNAGSFSIVQDASATALTAAQVLEVVYVGQDVRVITVYDTVSKAGRELCEGPGFGIYEVVMETSNANTSLTGRQLALSELQRRSFGVFESQAAQKTRGMSEVFTFEVWDQAGLVGDLALGQVVWVDPDGYTVGQEDHRGHYLIRGIEMYDELEKVLWRRVECVRGPIVYDSLESLSEMLSQGPPAAKTVAQAAVPVIATFHFDAPQVGDQTDWLPINVPGSPTEATATVVGAPSGNVYVDIQHTTDGGATWSSIFPGTVLIIASGAHTISPSPHTTFATDLVFLVAQGSNYVRAIILSGSAADATQLNVTLNWR